MNSKQKEKWAIVIFVIIGLIIVWNYSAIFGNEESNYLEEQGYDVLEFGSYESFGEKTAYTNMKSLGNRQDQVWAGLISLKTTYPEVDKYTVTIMEEKSECLYVIEGVILKPYLASLTGEVTIDSVKVKETLPYLMWSLFAKLEYEKKLKGENYDFSTAASYRRLMETGLDVRHFPWIINFQIDDPSRCE